MTNRDKLIRAERDIEAVCANPVIGPTAYEHLRAAQSAIGRALLFVLDEAEQDGIRREEVRR